MLPTGQGASLGTAVGLALGAELGEELGAALGQAVGFDVSSEGGLAKNRISQSFVAISGMVRLCLSMRVCVYLNTTCSRRKS